MTRTQFALMVVTLIAVGMIGLAVASRPKQHECNQSDDEIACLLRKVDPDYGARH